MTENLKNILQSINKTLNTDYNLISFDSLPEESLLQVLLDIFLKFNVITGRVKFLNFTHIINLITA
jgi:intraflagellar transport protein 81